MPLCCPKRPANREKAIRHEGEQRLRSVRLIVVLILCDLKSHNLMSPRSDVSTNRISKITHPNLAPVNSTIGIVIIRVGCRGNVFSATNHEVHIEECTASRVIGKNVVADCITAKICGVNIQRLIALLMSQHDEISHSGTTDHKSRTVPVQSNSTIVNDLKTSFREVVIALKQNAASWRVVRDRILQCNNKVLVNRKWLCIITVRRRHRRINTGTAIQVKRHTKLYKIVAVNIIVIGIGTKLYLDLVTDGNEVIRIIIVTVINGNGMLFLKLSQSIKLNHAKVR